MARLRTLEAKFRPEHDVPGLLIVVEEHGVWHDWPGAVVALATIDSRTQVSCFR
jgi:hypothetical protein